MHFGRGWGGGEGRETMSSTCVKIKLLNCVVNNKKLVACNHAVSKTMGYPGRFQKKFLEIKFLKNRFYSFSLFTKAT